MTRGQLHLILDASNAQASHPSAVDNKPWLHANKALKDYLSLIRDMRLAQRSYFRTRSGTDLQLSKDLEAKVDAVLTELAGPPIRQPELFGGSE